MVEKPSLFNGNYDHLHGSESLLNYERDLMLWEQTEAIKKLQQDLEEREKKVELNKILNSYSYDYSKPAEPYVYSGENINVFEVGTPLSDKYENLEAQQNNLLHKIKTLNSDVAGFVWLFILALVLIGFPSLIVTENKDLRLFMSIATPISLIIQAIIYITIDEMNKQIQVLKDEQMKLIKDNPDDNIYLSKIPKRGRKTTKNKKHKNRE